MKKSVLLFLCLLLISSTSLFAQLWTKTFNGTANNADAFNDMVVDADGNVYVTGYTSTPSHEPDFITIKYNSNGVQQWMVTYDGPGNGTDISNAIVVDESGNVYVTGFSDSLTGNFINDDVTTIKYSPNGILQWAKRYDGAIQRNDAGNDLKVDASGNVYVAGYKTVAHNAISRKDFLTVKYNSNGDLQWTATYNGPANENDEAVGLGIDAASNVYVTGYSFAGNDPLGENDYLTIKYNTSGVQKWVKRYNGPISEADLPFDIAVDSAGTSYVTGYSFGNDLDWATVAYNTNGGVLWVKREDGPAHSSDIAYAIALDHSGNVYVTGSDQKTINNSDFLTVKYNSSGVKQWSHTYNGPANDNDEAQAIAVDALGNVCVTGYINGVLPNADIATIKYNTAGARQWVRKFAGAGNGNDAGNSIGADDGGNVYVAGYTTGSGSDLDGIAIKYSPAGLEKISESVQLENHQAVLFQNYPDPFSVSTSIDYYLQQPSDVTITLTDAIGRVINEFRMGNMPAGNHSLEINGALLEAGYYFYTLKTNGDQVTKRMAVVK